MTQEEALNILKLGHNTFLTGGAGTGKTFVLNKFIGYLKEYNIPHAVTASTGIAATHIEGTTIHSYSGIGIKDNINDWDLEIMMSNEKLFKKINSTNVLIIDEVSMLHSSRLAMLDKVLRKLRTVDTYNKEGQKINNKSTPFGGMQVIFCGDFFQLPPVIRDKNISEEDIINEYAFRSKAWDNAKLIYCYLTENYRQEDDTLTNILNMIRNKDEDLYHNLESLSETSENNLINPVQLYSHNKDVDNINNIEYGKLEDALEFEYIMKSKGKKNLIENLKQSVLAPETLKLKINTKVIFVKNDKTGKYQNGTMGLVTSFDDENYPIVTCNNGNKIVARPDTWQLKDGDDNVLAEVSQIPIRLAWAITIHKSQGMTLDEAIIDLSKGFGYGMGYVALSRVRSLNGLKLLGLNNQALMVANPVLEYDKEIRLRSKKASSAIKKYGKEELKKMHLDTRIRMNGTENKLTEKELQEKQNKKLEEKEATHIKTLKLILEGKSINDISEIRSINKSTVINHLEDIASLPSCTTEIISIINKVIDCELTDFWLNSNIKNKKDRNKKIKEIKLDIHNNDKMKPVFDKYKDVYNNIDYEILKLMKIYSFY